MEAGLLGDSVAERVKACGMWSKRVDGADVVGVYAAIDQAFRRARDGRGPGLVEAVVTRVEDVDAAERDRGLGRRAPQALYRQIDRRAGRRSPSRQTQQRARQPRQALQFALVEQPDVR